MKMRWFLLVSGFSTAHVFSAISTRLQTVLTFDDPQVTGRGSDIPSNMDNFTFEFIPEPSSLLLTSLGVVML
jgi:hypothetical protein